MSLSGLRLHHGLRGGCAAPEPEAVAVATPLFRCPVWHRLRLGCAFHPSLRGGSLRVQQSFAGRPEDAHGRSIPTFRRVYLAPPTRALKVPTEGRSASGPLPASKRRRSPWTSGETQTEGAAEWQTRIAVSGPRVAMGRPGPATTRSHAGRRTGASLSGNGRSRWRIGSIRRVPQRRSDSLPAGIDSAGATQGAGARGRGEV